MKRVIPKWFLRFGFLTAVAGIFCLMDAVILAQPRPGNRTPTRPQQPRPQVKKPPLKATQKDQPKGWIIKFTPPKDGANDDLLGILAFKPGNKDAKSLRFELRKSDTVSFMLSGRKLTPEQLPELLMKGLYCTANWDEVPGDVKKVKHLKSLTLDAMEIEARVEEVQEGHIVLRALPKNGDWPDVTPQQGGPAKPQPNKPETTGPKQRKLKLKIVENISKFTEKNKKTNKEPSDFEVGEPVIASVIYGRNDGMIVEMRPPVEGEAKTALGRPLPKKKDDSGD